MTSSYLRLIRVSFFLCTFLPVIVSACSGILLDLTGDSGFWLFLVLGALGACSINLLLGVWLTRSHARLEAFGLEQARFLDQLPDRYLEAAILGSAALSLFLELAMIRWQSSVWEFFAFYKNLGLLSCFAGLGLGYALARRDRIPLVLVTPALAFQIALLVLLRHGMGWRNESLLATPFQEQLNMGFKVARSLPHYTAVYCFITAVFLLTALAFVPVGQVCGRLMARLPPLRAYRLNLLGSLAGVVLMLGTGYLWTPPAIWFLLCFLGIAVLQGFHYRPLAAAMVSAFLGLAVLVWPVNPGWERIYSPYQLLERGVGEHGLMMIRAAGHYYQRVHDLSSENQRVWPAMRAKGSYYEMPYRLRPAPPRVAIVGAGTGNDVAAALRSGAQRVDAIEIDPAIQALGLLYHPENPYGDPRVRRITDDARSFLRKPGDNYDLIVYGLLDSHTLLSHASSVRLDSFVYTVEGIREARARLTENGIISLSFAVMSNEIGRKIYLMMTEAFDGHSPVCILAGYDGSVIFLQARRGDLRIPETIVAQAGFQDITRLYDDPAIRADVSTDDWPYFYMPQRVYPLSYLFMVAMMLLLSAAFFANFLSDRPRFSQAAYFFLGAGFMLVETKGITEMGLTFGNTWQVIGFVIAGVLIMAYLANGVVESFRIRKPWVPYLMLLASLGLGLWVARIGGFPPTLGGKLATAVILTCPLFFSGIVFSTLLAGTREIAGAMALNLLGAMCGGLLEYNSMYFGFQFLYWIAIVLYLAALLSGFLLRKAVAAPALLAAQSE